MTPRETALAAARANAIAFGCTLGRSTALCGVHGTRHPTAGDVLHGRVEAARIANAERARADFADRARVAGEGRTCVGPGCTDPRCCGDDAVSL